MPEVSVDRVQVRPGLHLATRAWRGDREPAFVLVHGLASNARMWDGVAARLSAAGHRVVAVDQRGHGRSDTPADGYDTATVVGDLELLLDRCDLRRPVLVGQSWGGNVVLEAAASRPDRVAGVAAVDGGTIDLRRRFPDWEECAEVLAPPSFDALTLTDAERMLRDRHADWSDEAIAGGLANFVENDDHTVRPRLGRGHHMQILRAMWERSPAEVHAAVGAPVLLLPADTGDPAWTSDKRIGVEQAAAALARTRVRWLEGDHDLHAQQPTAVATVLLEAVTDGFFA